ncbi:MAG TPA: GAF domain-containing SpoIIE family protein phosphatase [Pirellulaceae bacterium]|nr:GAF domain-containing SpoIIE family protein phosphatase [Pirellulaceae bacterium]
MTREPDTPVADAPFPSIGGERYCHSLSGLNRLLEVTRVLAEELDLGRTLDAIVAEACIALRCERAILYQYDVKRQSLFSTAGSPVPLHLELDQGIPGFVARQHVMVNVPEPARDSRWDALFDRKTGIRTRSILCVPLIAGRDGRLLGVLELLNNLGGPFDEDDESLALAFSRHAAAALDRTRLVDELQGRREMEASLNVAREIQRRFMPSKLPHIPRYDVATWWFPNEAVGGDYCDVIQLADGQVALCVADVCGHGLGPSLLMASVRASLRTLILSHSSPQLLIESLSMALADDFQPGAFVTMILAMLDPATHTLHFANAGHAPALLYRAASREFVELESTGLPIGILEAPDCPLGPRLELTPGDLLVLGTDGIVESMDERGNQFGLERFQQLLGSLASEPVEHLVRQIGREVELHYVGDSPPDDLTLLVLRRVT